MLTYFHFFPMWKKEPKVPSKRQIAFTTFSLLSRRIISQLPSPSSVSSAFHINSHTEPQAFPRRPRCFLMLYFHSSAPIVSVLPCARLLRPEERTSHQNLPLLWTLAPCAPPPPTPRHLFTEREMRALPLEFPLGSILTFVELRSIYFV